MKRLQFMTIVVVAMIFLLSLVAGCPSNPIYTPVVTLDDAGSGIAAATCPVGSTLDNDALGKKFSCESQADGTVVGGKDGILGICVRNPVVAFCKADCPCGASTMSRHEVVCAVCPTAAQPEDKLVELPGPTPITVKACSSLRIGTAGQCVVRCWDKAKPLTVNKPILDASSYEDCGAKALATCKTSGNSYCQYNYPP
jgi:hypothetical protein